MNPNSKKPKLLDWIKERTGRFHEDFDPRAHGHKSWEGVWQELRKDGALGKLRDESRRNAASRQGPQTADRGEGRER